MLRELWIHRNVIFLFAITEVKLRYKNSVLGFLWTFLEPLLMLAVLYFIFTNVIKTEIQYYPLYLLLGLIIWYMFSRGTTMGLTCLTDKSNILQKINLPKGIFVVSSNLTSLIMLIFEIIAFSVFLVAFQFIPPLTILYLPLIFLAVFALSTSLSFLLSILNVYFQDIKFIWQIILQAGFFLSPIIYSLDMFPENIKTLLEISPLTKLINAAHDVTLYNQVPSSFDVIYITFSIIGIFLIGWVVFRAKEREIVEHL